MSLIIYGPDQPSMTPTHLKPNEQINIYNLELTYNEKILNPNSDLHYIVLWQIES